MIRFIQKIFKKKKQKTLAEAIVTDMPRKIAETFANR